ncbi:hypothetical protein [Nocardia bovistercoris]|uniref:Uncharacterized protein n=1 Tax=Nocardia bovistercoris TaxID=2785916 RepID=A0A931IJH5_9NOCA|nr:hypothetical protein [Nocardia bovistercoris]MBH0781471.1 hypothetical protein [Nocardia bovistercoris]
MTDPTHVKACLTCRDYADPVLSAFLAPEPLASGRCILHLLEQAPLRAGLTMPHPDLITLIQAHSDPTSVVRAEFRVFTTRAADPHPLRAILADHAITDPAPVGLDPADPDDLTRLSLLPEHRMGPRRVDDFQDEAVRAAMLAIYTHFAIDQQIPLLYHGYANPTTGWLALPTATA